MTNNHLDSKVESSFAPLRTDLAVLKWMMGLMLAGVMSLVLKTFL